MDTYAERLRFVMDKRKVTQRQLAEATGITQQSIGYLCRLDGKDRKSSHTLKIAKFLNVDPGWLDTGIATEEQSKISIIEKLNKKFDDKKEIEPNSSEFVDIPFYCEDVALSLGDGTVVHDNEQPARQLTFKRSWLDSMNLKPKDLAVVKCRGDSMEPRIHDGDVVLINTSNEATEIIKDGAIYALSYGNEARLKRLITRADGSLIIRSDNTSLFPDEEVPKEIANQLKIVGRAVWVGGVL